MFVVLERESRKNAYGKQFRRLANAIGAARAMQRKGVDTVIRPANRGSHA